MFRFEEIRRTVAAAIGAIILSTVCIGAAIGPVQAKAESAVERSA